MEMAVRRMNNRISANCSTPEEYAIEVYHATRVIDQALHDAQKKEPGRELGPVIVEAADGFAAPPDKEE